MIFCVFLKQKVILDDVITFDFLKLHDKRSPAKERFFHKWDVMARDVTCHDFFDY